MKQFIYLDTDIVASIIAQEENGLITQQTQETDTSLENSTGNAISGSLDAKGGAKVLKLIQAEANLNLSGEHKKTSTSGTSTKDVAEKILHDAAFDIAYNYISITKAEMGNEKIGDEGEYLEISRVYDYVDFTYLETLFDKDGIIDYLKRQTADEVESDTKNILSDLNREQARKIEASIKNKSKQIILEKNKQYDDVLKMIRVIRKLIPYERMMISSDGFLIPLDNKYFRIDPSNLGFKYGGEMTCVGMVTNIIGKDTEPCDDSNIFTKLQHSVNEVLRSILPTKNDNICVIHPIAVYYGR